ncbi:MAG: 2-dehydropantoate 2-reductase [Arenicella sp.]
MFDSDQKLKIAVVGSGAIGCFYGAKLQQAGHEVHFLLRSDYAHVKQHGLQILSHDGDFVLDTVNAHTTTETIGECDLVIVAIKTTANTVLADLLPPLLNDTTLVLTLQNGMGNIENLSATVAMKNILGGLCFICANRVAPGVVRNQDHGAIELGEPEGGVTERLQNLAAMFVKAGVPCQAGKHLKDTLWRKLIWNVPFNGLSIAAGEIATDKILQNPQLLELVTYLQSEIQAAAKSDGVDIADEFVQLNIAKTRTMGAYQPSSLIDYSAGRAVEVETIWGEPLRRAKANGVAVPYLEGLYLLLKGLVELRCEK